MITVTVSRSSLHDHSDAEANAFGRYLEDRLAEVLDDAVEVTVGAGMRLRASTDADDGSLDLDDIEAEQASAWRDWCGMSDADRAAHVAR
jgi:hypothetical protein